jgi:hypothetical protein
VGQETAVSWSTGFAALAGAAKAACAGSTAPARDKQMSAAGASRRAHHTRCGLTFISAALRQGKCPDRNCLRKEDA